nr:hypothetical protein [Angustibacter aerolatus]
MLRAGGRRAVAAGNVGVPVLDAVIDPDGYDVIAVEVSSPACTGSTTPRPAAGCRSARWPASA